MSALGEPTAVFPGPLFGDPGAPGAGLVRPSAAVQVKIKKVAVLKYLDERCEELQAGLPYHAQHDASRFAAEGKLVLVKLLRVMVEHDGRINGS